MSKLFTRRICCALLVLALAAACTPEQQPIRYGHAICARCTMTIMENQYGSELVSLKGKVYTFDSVECLLAFRSRQMVPADQVHSIWVTSFDQPGQLIAALTAAYLQSEQLPSPMGMNLTAFSSAVEARAAQQSYGGTLLTWEDLHGLLQNHHAEPPHRHSGAGSRTITIRENSPKPLAEAISRCAPGDTLRIPAGIYQESPVIIDRRITIIGENYPVLDGENLYEVLIIRADSVAIEGITVQNSGVSYIEDQAGIKIEEANGCRIENCRLIDNFFAIYLAKSKNCALIANRISGQAVRESSSGNGIHLWYCRDILIEGNQVEGHRDGIYLEFVRNARVQGNHTAANLRYGLHFMFSDSCHYRQNRFEQNGAGVAVMYTKYIEMEDNVFIQNWGSASFGLLLKDITDSRIMNNRFQQNTIAIYAENSIRNTIVHNSFDLNGWAVKILSNCNDNYFSENNFSGNAFDVATNGRNNFNTFERNYWQRYEGYDLNRDGTGDVPYHPVRLFSAIVGEQPPSLILLHSAFVTMLEVAERVLPILTPESLLDRQPLLKPVQMDHLQNTAHITTPLPRPEHTTSGATP